MILLAGLAVGVFVYFLVGYATGYTPEMKIRRFRRRSQISNRPYGSGGTTTAHPHPLVAATVED